MTPYTITHTQKVLTVEVPITWVPWSTAENVALFQVWSAMQDLPVSTPIEIAVIGKAKSGEIIPGTNPQQRYWTAMVTANVTVPMNWNPRSAINDLPPGAELASAQMLDTLCPPISEIRRNS